MVRFLFTGELFFNNLTPNILFLHFCAFINCSHYSWCWLVKISAQFFKTAKEQLIMLKKYE